VDDNDFARAITTTTKSLDATRERFGKWYGAVGALTGRSVEMPACLTD
jgi:hypothetical protein